MDYFEKQNVGALSKTTTLVNASGLYSVASAHEIIIIKNEWNKKLVALYIHFIVRQPQNESSKLLNYKTCGRQKQWWTVQKWQCVQNFAYDEEKNNKNNNKKCVQTFSLYNEQKQWRFVQILWSRYWTTIAT